MYRLSYRSLEPEDISLLYKWENDIEINRSEFI